MVYVDITLVFLCLGLMLGLGLASVVLLVRGLAQLAFRLGTGFWPDNLPYAMRLYFFWSLFTGVLSFCFGRLLYLLGH